MSEVNLPLCFAFWEESDKTTHFFVHVSLLILCWVVITEQFGQAAPTNLGSFSDKKRSGGNDYTNKKTSNLLDNHKPSNMEVPRKTKVPFFQSYNSSFFSTARVSSISWVCAAFVFYILRGLYKTCTRVLQPLGHCIGLSGAAASVFPVNIQ